MLAGGNPRQSSAACVAMETVIGTLHGRAGTLTIVQQSGQHSYELDCTLPD